MPRFVKYLRSPDQFPGGFSFRPTHPPSSNPPFFFFFSLPFSSISRRSSRSASSLFIFFRPHVSFIQSGTNGSEVMPSESSLEIILSRRKSGASLFLSSRRGGASQPRSLRRLFSPSISFGSRKGEEFHHRWIVVGRGRSNRRMNAIRRLFQRSSWKT